MSDTVKTRRVRRVHHTGRTSQVGIYLGKQFRFFVNQSDWKVLPMAAIIAGRSEERRVGKECRL